MFLVLKYYFLFVLLIFFFFVNGTQYFSVDHSSIFTYLDGYLSGFIDGKRLGETTMVKSISN